MGGGTSSDNEMKHSGFIFRYNCPFHAIYLSYIVIEPCLIFSIDPVPDPHGSHNSISVHILIVTIYNPVPLLQMWSRNICHLCQWLGLLLYSWRDLVHGNGCGRAGQPNGHPDAGQNAQNGNGSGEETGALGPAAKLLQP